MSADAIRRLTRLREVLPSVYDTRPGDSQLGTVLLRVAEALAGMDEAQRRVLHDRWLPLAFGTAPGNGGLPALDRLGALLDTPRLAVKEDAEAYRARIATTARALTGGMATPRALLALALAAVGTEICPKLKTLPEDPLPEDLRVVEATKARGGMPSAARRRPEDPWVVEATEARGMPPAARRRCTACHNPGAPCPLAGEAAAAEAYLVENPVTQLQRRVEAAYGLAFPVESRSLTTDRPVIRLSPLGEKPLSNPAVQNCATGETVLFQGHVKPGETLVLWPRLEDEELRPFDSIDADAHHSWVRRGLSGRAMLGESDVSASVFFMSGSRFDDADTAYYAKAAAVPSDPAELGTRFAVMVQAVRTPRLRPGTDPWRLLLCTDAATGSGSETNKDGTEAEQARLLFTLLKRAEEEAPKAPGPIAALDIEWLVRPPATVRLCLWRSPQVEAAQALGAIDLLMRDLDLVRPAGVQTLFEIRERPLPREALAPAERAVRVKTSGRWREDATPTDRLPQIDLRVSLPAERHQVGDSQPAWPGRFDNTTFDASRLT